MAEPILGSAAATVAVASGIGVVSILTGLDGNALVGAFAGAAFFVLRAKEVAAWVRGAYFFISLPAGYICSAEILNWWPIKERGVAAFIAAAVVLTIADRVLDWLRSASLSDIINRIRGGGSK